MAVNGGPGLGRRLADIVGSVLTALVVVGAVPAVLVTLVGYPLAGGLGHHWSHPARIALSVLALVAWVAWLACCAQLSRAVVQRVRRGQVGVAAGAPLTERLAARIAIGILAVTTMGAPLVVVATSAGAATTVIAAAPTPAAAGLGVVAAAPTPAATVTYVVKPGDSLWTIAQTQLGDGADWTAVAALNLGRTMPDGRHFLDPSLIRPGWDLTMPSAPAEADVADLTSNPAADPAEGPIAAPVSPAAAPAMPVSPAMPPTPTTIITPTTTGTTRITDPAPLGTTHATPAGPAESPGAPAHSPSSLPELAALGLGAIACAALARRARRRRLLQQFSAPRGGASEPSESAIDTDVLLSRFYDVPALDAFERANCRLGQALFDAGTDDATSIRAVCVGTFGVDFCLSRPGLAPPPGFDLVDDGTVWHLSYGQMDGQALDRPGLPVVLPIGDDDDGTWLLPIAAGDCLPLTGPAAADLWRAARRVQEAWAWADMVTVTEDPDQAAHALAAFAGDQSGPRRHGLPILFFGDPQRLDPAVRAGVALVTTTDSPATDLTVLVDSHRASIHPLARSVRPHLVSADTAAHIDELVAPVPTWEERDAAGPADPGPGPVDHDPTALALVDNPVAQISGDRDMTAATSLLVPGPVEIKLLTVTPRIEGLREALPPNRERRAIELVAYLALHRPDTVTSDRLRTRVLGSADADAAAKTLFNTATAARRALGVDEEGGPLFPPGTRTGQYRVADALTVDVQRAAALAEVGNGLEDPDLAIAFLRAALELIESEPMANALSGYTWWEGEGHGGRIAAVLVNAACNLAALAMAAELFDLAQWGLERARLVDPYSESLSRAAMQVAAAAGDADRLRREWSDCQRRIDELDPGSSPSPRTERLFGELAQAVLI